MSQYTYVGNSRTWLHPKCSTTSPVIKKTIYEAPFENLRAHIKIGLRRIGNRALFADEMSIKVGLERTSVVYVWRKRGEEFHKDCVDGKITLYRKV